MTTFSLKQTLLTVLLVILSTSVFSLSNNNEDERMKIRLGFISSTNFHRQILVTEDANATSGIDFGYDGETFDNFQDDMYWMLDDRRFVIQGIDVIDTTTILPLGLHTGTNGLISIAIEGLENVPDTLEIVIYDTENNTYHNIKDNDGFSIDLQAGTYLERFELRFADNTQADDTDDNDSNTDGDEDNGEGDTTDEDNISTEAETNLEDVINTEGDTIKMQFINSTKSIAIQNSGSKTINSVELYNFTGQLITQYNSVKIEDKTVLQANNLKAGNYIIVVNTNIGSVSKKVTVK